MVTKAQKVRLGIFLAIGSLLILVFVGAVAGNQLFQKRDIYYIEYSDVSVNGLQVGGSVNYHGIKVGRIETIKVNTEDVSKVIVTISLEAGTPIKTDVEATLVPVGITGLKSVEIKGGTNQSALLKPKSYIPTGTSTFDNITDRAVSIAEKIDMIASNLANITNAGNQENIASILRETSLLLVDTRANLGETLKNLSVIASNAAEIAGSAASNLTKITDSVSKNINDVSAASILNMDRLTNTTTSQLDSLGNNANLLISDTRYRLNSVGDHTDQMIIQTTKDIGMMTASINQSLQRINYIVNSAPFDSLVVNVNGITKQLAASDLKKLVTDLNQTVNNASSLIANMDRTVTRGRTDLLETLESLREASENLNEFSKQISENPSSLLIGNKAEQ
jgi:ABC-type transporter Mla subunit MlaD